MRTKLEQATHGMVCFWAILITTSFLLADHQPPELQTVAQGDISSFRYGEIAFKGADLIITNQRTWAWFWRAHSPDTEPPRINFAEEMVIATLLGYQPTGGGPSIKIVDADLDHDCGCFHVKIEDDRRQGPLDVITNPYHIVKLRRLDTETTVFEHQNRE